MKQCFLVSVDVPETVGVASVEEEIQSNLESCDFEDIRVTYVEHMAEDLQTLYTSCTDYTEPIHCSAALANYVGELAEAIGVELHEAENPHGRTDLDRFIMASKPRK